MKVSLLIAAGAYYFFLDEKVTKNQDKKILPPSRPLPYGPGFLSGLSPRLISHRATLFCPLSSEAEATCIL
jgi:hypothetical protein